MEARCFLEPVDVRRKKLFCEKMLLDSNFFCLKTTRRASAHSSEFEMKLTPSFLSQSDKLVIGPHLLLFPATKVVKPTEHEFAHHPKPIQEEVWQCSQQNRKSK